MPDADVIAVGYVAATALGLAVTEVASQTNDSYLISSSARRGIPAGSYVVTGSKNSTRGTLFGVYDFLRNLGCRFLAPDFVMAEELPAQPPSTLPPMDVKYTPHFKLRDVENGEYRRRLASGVYDKTDPSWIEKAGYNGQISGSMNPAYRYAGGYVHTSYSLLGAPKAALWSHALPVEQHPKEHPSQFLEACASHSVQSLCHPRR